jgi:hypothetical protein
MAISRDAPITARTGLAARAATLRSGCRFLDRPTRPLVLRCASPPLKDARPPTCGGRTTRQKAAVAAAALSGRGTPRGVRPPPTSESTRQSTCTPPAAARAIIARQAAISPQSSRVVPGSALRPRYKAAPAQARQGCRSKSMVRSTGHTVRTRACRWGDDRRRRLQNRTSGRRGQIERGVRFARGITAREARRQYFLGAPRHSDNALRGLISAQALSCGDAPAAARECSCIRCRRGVKTTQPPRR